MDKKTMTLKCFIPNNAKTDAFDNLDIKDTIILIDTHDESKVNNVVLDAVIKCDCELERYERAKMELDYNKCMDCKKEIQ